MCMCMGTKTISIMDDVYKILVSRKKEGESFSDIIRMEFKKKRNIIEFAGAWKDISDKEIEEMKKNIEMVRKGMINSAIRRIKKL